MLHRFLVLCAACLLAPVLRAHTVPTITVEAEFSAGHEITLRVNLDPRLFLSEQPTALPPVPATWWFDQDEKARAGSIAAAQAYIEKNLRFQAGDFPVEGRWKLAAIDSASAFPLGPTSTEVHLLAELRGPLPESAGEFKVTLDPRAAVGLILLNSVEGKPERHPQAIFPGESSRGFQTPGRTGTAVAPAATVNRPSPLAVCCDGVVQFCRTGFRHFAGDHLIWALVLAAALGGRILPGVALIALFHACHIFAALTVVRDWLPEAPLWMRAAGWGALAAGLFLAHRHRLARAAVCFSIAGFCHGLDLSHLHLETANHEAVLRDAALIGAAQIAVLILARLVVAVAARRQQADKAGMQPG